MSINLSKNSISGDQALKDNIARYNKAMGLVNIIKQIIAKDYTSFIQLQELTDQNDILDPEILEQALTIIEEKNIVEQAEEVSIENENLSSYVEAAIEHRFVLEEEILKYKYKTQAIAQERENAKLQLSLLAEEIQQLHSELTSLTNELNPVIPTPSTIVPKEVVTKELSFEEYKGGMKTLLKGHIFNNPHIAEQLGDFSYHFSSLKLLLLDNLCTDRGILLEKLQKFHDEYVKNNPTNGIDLILNTIQTFFQKDFGKELSFADLKNHRLSEEIRNFYENGNTISASSNFFLNSHAVSLEDIEEVLIKIICSLKNYQENDKEFVLLQNFLDLMYSKIEKSHSDQSYKLNSIIYYYTLLCIHFKKDVHPKLGDKLGMFENMSPETNSVMVPLFENSLPIDQTPRMSYIQLLLDHVEAMRGEQAYDCYAYVLRNVFSMTDAIMSVEQIDQILNSKGYMKASEEQIIRFQEEYLQEYNYIPALANEMSSDLYIYKPFADGNDASELDTICYIGIHFLMSTAGYEKCENGYQFHNKVQ